MTEKRGDPKRPSGSDRKRRETTPEEMALWRQAARSFRPREKAVEPEPKPVQPPPAEKQTAPPPPPAPAPPRMVPTKKPGPPGDAAGKSLLHRLSTSTPGLDRNTARRLKQGRTPPEARIDLHGMTVARAHDALVGFIRREHGAGRRCVLVITGKGGRRSEEFDPTRGWRDADMGGVLKSMTPQWLGQPPLRALVVGVYPAHQRHGGEGAFYVYLRKGAGS